MGGLHRGHVPAPGARRASGATTSWAVYAACAWALLFAAQSFYGAAGGTLGLETFGRTIERQARARDPDFLATVWTSGALKLVAALLVLGLVVVRSGAIRKALRITVGIVGVLCALYGIADLVQHTLMQVGVLDVPDGLGRVGLRWHLALWDPYWIVGGALFLIAAAGPRATRPLPR